MAKITKPEEPTEPTKPDVLPTEQLPVETQAEVLPENPPTAAERRPSAVRRHPVATAIIAGVVAVLIAIGLTAWGVSSAVTSSLASATSSSIPATTQAPATKAGRKVFRGTIESVSGETWTVLTRAGRTITVAVGDTTTFDTPRKPATASSFASGDAVILVATGTATSTMTAVRVVAARAVDSTPAPMSTPST